MSFLLFRLSTGGTNPWISSGAPHGLHAAAGKEVPEHCSSRHAEHRQSVTALV